MNVENGGITKRTKYLDAARGFALLAVMVGHCITKGTFLHKFIFSFHVPMFFLISGYLYKCKEGATLKDLKRLAIPYAVVVMIVAVFGKVMASGGYYGNTKNLILAALFGAGVKHGDILLIGSIWFWPTIFLARRYLDCIFTWFTKDKARAAAVIALVLAGVGLAKEKIWAPMNADVALVAAGFMFAGYLIHKYQIKMTLPVMAACIAFWIMSLSCERINIGKRDYEVRYITFVGAVGAGFLFLELFRWLEQVKLLGWLTGFFAFTGRHTIALLAIHDLDWRMPFQIWGGKAAEALGSVIHPTLIWSIRRLSFDYACLLLWIFVLCLCKRIWTKFKKTEERSKSRGES